VTTEGLSLIVVFLEGLASFASPCVLPLLPIYLSYLAGASLEEIEKNSKLRRSMVFHSIGFALGLSVVFIGLGATASAIGRFVYLNGDILRKASGVIIIVFGLHHAGMINLKFLNFSKKMEHTQNSPKFLKSVLLGITFSFGWTPCVGPILGSVLMLAGNTETIWAGMGLLTLYSLGLSIPFIISALTINLFLEHFQKIYERTHIIKLVSGILLIIMGILVYSNYFYRLTGFLS